MEILLQILLLAVGFFLLIKGADWFVDGASAIAARLGIPQLIIGLTIVAMGTSLPEAAISISAAAKGSAGIAVGNVLGSNTLNVLLILGVTALISPITVERSVTRIEIPFLLAVSAILPVLGLPDSLLSRWDGVILWILFVVYLGYLLYSARRSSPHEESAAAPDKTESIPKSAFFIVLGAAMIVFGSNLTIDAASFLARVAGMSDRLIGLTIVAIGTSLPELVTSITAARKGKTDIAVGNVVGSNLFNILFVLGSSALIVPIPYASAFIADSVICLATSVLLMTLVIRDAKLQRSNGLIMLLCFAGYYSWLFLA